MDHRRKEPRGSGIHVLDRIEAVPVDVGICDPQLVDLAKMAQRGGDRVGVDRIHAVHDPALPVMEILEAEEVPVGELGKVVEVADLSLAGEGLRALKLGRPDRAVGIRMREIGRTDRAKGEARRSLIVAKASD